MMTMFKKLFITSTICVSMLLIVGCAAHQPQKPQEKIVIKKVYVKRKIPEIKLVNLKDLNLSNDKPLKIKFKVHHKLIKGDNNVTK